MDGMYHGRKVPTHSAPAPQQVLRQGVIKSRTTSSVRRTVIITPWLRSTLKSHHSALRGFRHRIAESGAPAHDGSRGGVDRAVPAATDGVRVSGAHGRHGAAHDAHHFRLPAAARCGPPRAGACADDGRAQILSCAAPRHAHRAAPCDVPPRASSPLPPPPPLTRVLTSRWSLRLARPQAGLPSASRKSTGASPRGAGRTSMSTTSTST